MSWPALLVTFGSLFALACGAGTSSSSNGPSQALHQPAALAPGETAQFGALRVTFTGVSGDSRCPVDVTCVWEGDAVAQIRLSEPTGAVETRELHTNTPRSTTYGQYKVELVRLDPAPRDNQQIPAASYRLTVRVTQGS
ncbi:MAG TPA: hypothetical protein VFQ51_12085 [Vicinamibacteria bacterium]|nr:hypothetical protein [Vicinamibacteria bacterium]